MMTKEEKAFILEKVTRLYETRAEAHEHGQGAWFDAELVEFIPVLIGCIKSLEKDLALLEYGRIQ